MIDSICKHVFVLFVAAASLIFPAGTFGQNAQPKSANAAIATAHPKMVKIVGSGGLRGLESYQSGFCISADGYILTAWSYVLDSDEVSVTVADGQQFIGRLKGYDPLTEIAVLKIETSDIEFFDLSKAVQAKTGQRVYGFSNLFNIAVGDESVSVQKGVIASVSKLQARRGTYDVPFEENVYVIDAMTNNPGAAGGALTDRSGQLLGVLGKEVRDRRNNTWLSYAIPIEAISGAVDDIIAGRKIVASSSGKKQALPREPMTLALLGFQLVPNIVGRTPPFVDSVVENSAAERSGLRADDLVVEVNGQLTPTQADVLKRLLTIDRDAEFSLTIDRNNRFEKLKLKLGQ